MREILFRGKRVDNGEWVYGLFARCKVGNLILPCIQRERENDSGDYIEAIIVNGNTLGQYTGMTDRNGNKIFEGDDFKDDDDNGAILHCVFKDGAFCVEIQAAKGALMEYGYDEYAGNYEVIECENISYYDGYLKIIGNIHDGA